MPFGEVYYDRSTRSYAFDNLETGRKHYGWRSKVLAERIRGMLKRKYATERRLDR